MRKRLLVACEYSGIVREAFRANGWDAMSCDIIDSEDESPHHIKCDVLTILDDGWDMMIAHPPCTYTALCQAWRCNRDRERARKRELAVEFARKLWQCNIPRIAIENPKSQLSTLMCPKSQTIHPWQYGHPEFKETWMWLKNLPALRPTDILEPPDRISDPSTFKQWERVFRMGRHKDRWKNRSRTYPGIAKAMADQWGALS